MRRPNGITRILEVFVRSALGRPLARAYLGLLRLLEVTRRTLLPTELVLMEGIMGSYLAQGLYVIARLGIPDLLAEAPRSADELAALVHCQGDPLGRVLAFLATRGVVHRRRDGRFALSRAGYGLTTGANSFKGFAELNGSRPNWLAWGALLDGVRTGEAPFKISHGREFFDYTQMDPEFSGMFDRAMVGFAEATIPLIANAYKFGQGTIVDVGGGRGALMAGILRRHRQLRGVVFDLPQVVRDAPAYLAAAGVGERARIAEGSFFDGVPAGHEYYVMKSVLHDWGETECLTILRHVAQAMKPDGRLLIAELLIRPRELYPLSRALDLGMLVLTRAGRERTLAEFEGLLRKAGFALLDAITTTDFMTVLVAGRDGGR
jgi:hypothetical protein